MKLSLLPLLAILTACSLSSDDWKTPEVIIDPVDPITFTRDEADMLASTNDMTWRLLTHNLQDGDNTLLSPLSLSACLAMMQNGAGGETERQICDFLGFAGRDMADVNLYYSKILMGMSCIDSTVTFTSANSVWCNSGRDITPQEDFKQTLQKYYYAEMHSADFSDGSTLNDINRWANDNTHGLIPHFLDRLDSDALGIILNAIYYKAAWQQGFDKHNTYPNDFFLSDGTKVVTKFMHQRQHIPVMQDNAITIAFLPMGSKGRFYTFFVLPHEGYSMTQAIEATSAALADKAQGKAHNQRRMDVELAIPKFVLKTSKSLKADLLAVGLTLPFDDQQCDFTHMFDGNNRAVLTDIMQSCYFSIDETSVEAAAVTGGFVGTTSIPSQPDVMYFTLDRPFLFGICEASSGAILFAGAMENPTK